MLELINLKKSFGGIVATNQVDLEFPTGSLSAIIGPNGAGKTTIFNLISSQLRPSAGQIMLNDKDLVGLNRSQIVRAGIVRAFQVASLFPSLTVIEAMIATLNSHTHQSMKIWHPFRGSHIEDKAIEILSILELDKASDTLISSLSHGDQKLLDIGLALAMEPKVLLLDEPTAGLGPQERWKMIEQIEGIWKKLGITVIFIEHDMDIVFATAQKIHVLVSGTVIASGTPEQVRGNQKVIDAYLGSSLDDAPVLGAAS